MQSFNWREKISPRGRSNDLDKLAEKHKIIKNMLRVTKISRNRHCLKEKKSHTNSDSFDSDGEQELRRSAYEGQGGVKRQGTPVGNSGQGSRSGSAESDRSSSNEKNRKSRRYHHYHRHRRHHHRHHRYRSSPPSENRAEKQRNRHSRS